MQVILRVEIGESAGRMIWLKPHQQIVVGSNELADFALPSDGAMADRHFRLICDDQTCRVSEQENGTGLTVNGEPVATAILIDGDKIVAGETTFAVEITGGTAVRKTDLESEQKRETVSSPAVDPSPPIVGPSSPAVGPSSPAVGPSSPAVGPSPPAVERSGAPPVCADEQHFTIEPCNTDLTLFRGVDPIEPATFVQRLAPVDQLYLLVDFEKLGPAVPRTLAQREYLFDWLPGEIIEKSPLVISAIDTELFFDLLNEGWGQDCLVCLVSGQSKPALLDSLRSVLRGPPAESDKPADNAVLGVYCPSVLASLLLHRTPSFASDLLCGIDAVIVESEQSWQVFSHAEFVDKLTDIGLRPIENHLLSEQEPTK